MDDSTLRGAISEAIRLSAKSRHEIAEQMGTLLHCRVSVNMLNRFSSQSYAAVRFPAAWIPAFCEVVEDDRLQRLLLSADLLGLLEWAELNLTAATTLKEIEAARQELLADPMISGNRNAQGKRHKRRTR